MWITSIIVKDTIDKEQASQQMIDLKDFMDALWDAGVETGGSLLPPYTDRASAVAAFGPGVVYKRAWDLESSAQAVVDFINNHSANQVTATFDGEQAI
jgi:hypothetical protein